MPILETHRGGANLQRNLTHSDPLQFFSHSNLKGSSSAHAGPFYQVSWKLAQQFLSIILLTNKPTNWNDNITCLAEIIRCDSVFLPTMCRCAILFNFGNNFISWLIFTKGFSTLRHMRCYFDLLSWTVLSVSNIPAHAVISHCIVCRDVWLCWGSTALGISLKLKSATVISSTWGMWQAK